MAMDIHNKKKDRLSVSLKEDRFGGESIEMAIIF
jgi:hypothetical protein